jgi:RimJ/RimL family protein N-acetyltransferase
VARRAVAAGRATAGYAVLPSRRGHGYAAAARTALTAFAWTIEGPLRSHTEIGGTRRDMLLHAATR